MTQEGRDGFDGWLDQELSRMASGIGPTPLPARARYRATAAAKPRVFRIATLASTKAVMGLALTVVAAAAAGAAGESAVTGSVNPGTWIQQAVQQVETCSNALTHGHDTSACAGSLTLRHGQTGSTHSKPDSTQGNLPGQTDKHPGGRGDGGGAGGGGSPKDHGKASPPGHEPPQPPDHQTSPPAGHRGGQNGHSASNPHPGPGPAAHPNPGQKPGHKTGTGL